MTVSVRDVEALLRDRAAKYSFVGESERERYMLGFCMGLISSLLADDLTVRGTARAIREMIEEVRVGNEYAAGV